MVEKLSLKYAKRDWSAFSTSASVITGSVELRLKNELTWEAKLRPSRLRSASYDSDELICLDNYKLLANDLLRVPLTYSIPYL